MRGRGLRVLHVERAMRERSVDELPERIVQVLDGGGLPDRTELRQRHLRRVPVERRLWDASVQGGCLQPLFGIHRMQPDQSLQPWWLDGRSAWPCVREWRLWRVHDQQPVRRRGGVRARDLRHMHRQ